MSENQRIPEGAFKNKVLGFPEKRDLGEPALHKPTDEQLRNSIQAAREARLEGVGLRFQPNDVIVVFQELLDCREALAAMKRPPDASA